MMESPWESGQANVDEGNTDRQNIGGRYYWYALILSRFSVVVVVAVLLVSIACAATVFNLHGIPTFEEPTAGFEARYTTINSRLVAWENFYGSDLLKQQPANVDSFVDESFKSESQMQRRQADNSTIPATYPTVTSTSVQMCRSASLGNYAKLVFGASRGGDLFNDVAMIEMCQAEVEIMRSHVQFPAACQESLLKCGQENCPDSWSIGSYVALLNRKKSCYDIGDNDVLNTRSLLNRCASYYFQWYNRTACPNGRTPCWVVSTPIECMEFEAVHNILHFLVTEDFVTSISQDRSAALKYTTHIVPVELDFSNTKHKELNAIYRDNIHGYTYKYKEVTLKAIDFQIKFDLFDYFIFHDLVYIAVGLFVVVCILWMYTRSILIALATCLNIVLSMLLSYFCYFVVFRQPFFPFVNIASAVLVTGVGADDTFVYFDLWRKSLCDYRDARLHVVIQNTLHQATVTMLVTSISTAGSLYASIISEITAVRCFALFAGTAIMMNFLLTLTLLPAVIIVQHRLTNRYFKKRDSSGRPSWCTRYSQIMSTSLNTFFSPLRVFFTDILPVIVIKLRYIWIILFGALGIGGAVVMFVYPGLRLPTSSEFQILPENNYLEQWDKEYKGIFQFAAANQHHMIGYIFIGIQPTDTGNLWDPYNRGTLVLDNTFHFFSHEHQKWMRKFCQDMRMQEFYDENGLTICFIESLIRYMDRPCNVSSTGVDLSPCCNKNSFPYQESVFITCMRACSVTANCANGVRFSSDTNEFAAIYIRFQTTTLVTHNFQTMNKYYGDVNSWVETQMQEAPEPLQTGWFISQGGTTQLYFFDLQNSLATGTPTAFGVTLGIVLLIFICTILNVVLAFYAILTVSFAVFVTIGSLVLLGWELNIFESLIMTLSVGLCTDFTIHYGVAYRLAPHETRKNKSQFSLQTMIGAISVAAVSTFLAGLFILPSSINSYLQIGHFLMIVMFVSWVYSTFFFQSLCRVLGPVNSFGNLTSVEWCKNMFTKPNI